MPTTTLTAEDFDEEENIDLISLLCKAELVTSRSEGRRAIQQGRSFRGRGKKSPTFTIKWQKRTSPKTAWC